MPDDVFEKVKKETENITSTKGEINVPVMIQINNSNTNKRGRLSHR
jgi:hypothetical protein